MSENAQTPGNVAIIDDRPTDSLMGAFTTRGAGLFSLQGHRSYGVPGTIKPAAGSRYGRGVCSAPCAPTSSGGGFDSPLHSMWPTTPEEGAGPIRATASTDDREGVTMSICKIKSVERLRNERYMLTTVDGEIFTTAGGDGEANRTVRTAMSATFGEFWASIEFYADGYVFSVEAIA